MADLSFAALPNSEKRKLVDDLKGVHDGKELAAMFGVSQPTISRWLNPAVADKARETSRRWKANNKARVSQTEKLYRRFAQVLNIEYRYCECMIPANDHRMDGFCRRQETCIYCTKPRRS